MTAPVFSNNVFGMELARALDMLYAYQSGTQSADAEYLPLCGFFSVPNGTSFYEADALTRWFVENPTALRSLLVWKPEARAAVGWSAGRGMHDVMLDVRAQLHERMKTQKDVRET